MAITIVNRYNGKCQSCGTKLSAGEGFAYKNGYAWYKVCPSTACMARLGVTPPSAESNQPKTLSENGVISMPYDSKAITMLRSLPGAKWDPNNKNWICSVKTGDLPRVLEIADILQLSVPEALRQRCAEGTQESREALQRTFRKRIDGKELYDFQRTGVQFLALHERALLADDQGTGKAQPIDAMILTPNGWKPIGKLKINEFVIGSDGLPKKVIGIFPQGEKEIYEFTTSDARKTRCCIDHLWTVQAANERSRNPNKWVVKSTKELISGEKRSIRARSRSGRGARY